MPERRRRCVIGHAVLVISPGRKRRQMRIPLIWHCCLLAWQMLDVQDILVPADDQPDMALPTGDMSIFADLGLDEMKLAR
jgi:hypothetical protein